MSPGPGAVPLTTNWAVEISSLHTTLKTLPTHLMVAGKHDWLLYQLVTNKTTWISARVSLVPSGVDDVRVSVHLSVPRGRVSACAKFITVGVLSRTRGHEGVNNWSRSPVDVNMCIFVRIRLHLGGRKNRCIVSHVMYDHDSVEIFSIEIFTYSRH